MVAYLTSDPDIQKTFLRDELLPRLAEMLLCVLKQLVSLNLLGMSQSNLEITIVMYFVTRAFMNNAEYTPSCCKPRHVAHSAEQP